MSLDLFKAYATDATRETGGTWFDLEGGARVLVARAFNRNYSKLLGELYDKHRKALEAKTEEAVKLDDNLMIEVTARTILLGWERVSFKGQDLPYTIENAMMVLRMTDFRRLIMGFANETDAYRVKEEVEQGNA